MSGTVPIAFEQEFSDNFIHLAQQKTSKFESRVRFQHVAGAKAFHFDRLDAVELQKQTARHQDTPLSNIPHSRRRVNWDTYNGADLVDKADKARMSKDPTSDYMKMFVNAARRKKDEIIIASMTGNAFSIDEDDASSTVSFDTTNNQVAAGSADLTKGKIIEAKKRLLLNEVDPEEEPMYFGYAPDQLEAILNDTTLTSADYNTVRLLMEGTINSFMGFEWVLSTKLLKSGNNRSNLAWARGGIGFVMNIDIDSRISERPDKNYSTQAWIQISLGSTRVEDEKVIEVLCDESA